MYIYIFLVILLIYFFYYIYSYFKYEHIEYDYSDIDIIYFINLEHRKDRYNEFINEMKKSNIPLNKVIKIDAIYDKEKRDLACSKSHIKTLESFINSSYNNCIIFEDDFEFTDINLSKKSLKQLFKDKINYDIVMLSSNTILEEKTNYNYLNKIINAQTASGYLLNKNFANKLLENYKEGEKLFSDAYNNQDKKDYIYAVDQYWKKLQPISNWYVFCPKIGKQRKSYSDIANGVVDYKV